MEYASKGVAGTGLGLGIAGTALGLLNGNNGGNGLLGGLFGNNCNDRVSMLQAELAQQKSERYTDQQTLQTQKETFREFQKADDRLTAVISKMTDGFLQVGDAVSRLDKEVECIKTSMAKDQEINELKLQGLKAELSGAIALESERRACGDQNIYNYVNGTFVPGNLIMPASKICPPVQLECPKSTK